MSKTQFREVYDPLVSLGLTPTVDLVLVHGVDGDPIKTWTWQEKDSPPVFWPADLLPKERPTTRVLSFGFNAAMYHSNTTSTIRDRARNLLGLISARRAGSGNRPLILVGHCLGGLVIKQALCFANNEERYRPIASATKAVIFFGTPHNGADKSSWNLIAEGYAALFRTLPGKSSAVSPMANAIIRYADELEEMKEDFACLSPRYAITSFYETHTWGKTGQLIVPKMSARMMVPTEVACDVEQDHQKMCRFENAENVTFVILCHRINEAVAEDTSGGAARGKGVNSSQTPTKAQLGREEDTTGTEMVLPSKRPEVVASDRRSDAPRMVPEIELNREDPAVEVVMDAIRGASGKGVVVNNLFVVPTPVPASHPPVVAAEVPQKSGKRGFGRLWRRK
ncbi:uncharacterized protein C8A04DRAFT_31526 [Dichotomopilus funicola]|uniref:GPI inositol-deacylase n=1 Tax=Dichotomopilus funicola TaxID=1934379 RepID=A0AAN6ZKJ6_9PEZI|nr:hypothetical protein C8A04DRAFT_31526 [Dichotomopilus funicola]